MQKIYEARKEYGDVFVTIFNDGLTVPWKPLSVGEYIKYSQDYHRKIIPFASLENEIFQKCVIDGTIIRQMSFLKAGIITVVVDNIWEYSGPTSINNFNKDLQSARAIINAEGSRALHDITQVITMAFPYKPEEVYLMDYHTFLLRAAQAERKLINLGVMKEPIVMKDLRAEEEAHRKKYEASATQSARPRVDAKKLWEEQRQANQSTIATQEKEYKKTTEMPKEKWWNVSPVLEAMGQKKHNIDFATEKQMADESNLDNHDRAEHPIMRKYLTDSKTKESRAKMIKDAQWIYKDLIENINKSK